MNIFKELYAYRTMIYSLVRRDLRGRYKGSALGFLWTFINPLLQLGVYTLVFSEILDNKIDQYYLFLFVALVPWLFFSQCLTGGSSCIFLEQDMVKKIYFPREVLPIAYVTSTFVNMLLCFVVIFAVLIFSGFGINITVLPYLIVIFAVEYVMALGIAMLSSALAVFFRDLQYILSIIAMAWMYLTPIIYSVDIVPPGYRYIFGLNPMTPIVTAYRDILYYQKSPDLSTLSQGLLLGVVVLILGSLVFGKLKKSFAEEL